MDKPSSSHNGRNGSAPTSPGGSGMYNKSPNNNSNKNEVYCPPEGVKMPSSIDPSILQGDVTEILKQLPPDRINAAFEQYDYSMTQRGSEIRNPRAYLRGILKGSAGRYGLPSGVTIPPSISQSMLEDKDLVDTLKQMSARDINSCFRDFDDQIKKKSEIIRNKNAYLLGIIRSGPHFALPQGVVLPPTVSLAMLQGELLETVQQLPAAHINVAFGEYDEQIQKKGDAIRNRHGYLLGIIKRMKRSFEEEATEHVASMQQRQVSTSLSPTKDDSSATSATFGGQSHYNALASGGTPMSNGSHCASSPSTITMRDSPNKYTQSHDKLNLMTESFVKVTNELMTERKAKKDIEDQMKIEINRREETNQRVLKLMSALASEKEQRERSALDVERLGKDLTFERSLRESAEEKIQMLEENRDSGFLSATAQGLNPDVDQHEQLRKLELDLSIERGLRENTEKLLKTAENRIEELNREVQYLRENLQEERMKSPFGDWTSSPLAVGNGQHREDKKSAEFLTGLSDLVLLTDFDPGTSRFSKAQSSRIAPCSNMSSHGSTDRLGAELNAVTSMYDHDDIHLGQGEITRNLKLAVDGLNEDVLVTLKMHLPSGYPDHGILHVDAALADNQEANEHIKRLLQVSLPSLIDSCRSEAERSAGGGALIPVLTTADYWTQVDWFDIQANHLASSNGNAASKHIIQIGSFLLQTNFIGNIVSLQVLAAKHGLGGYARIGERGYLLVEGRENKCEIFLDCINLQANGEEARISSWSPFVVVARSSRSCEGLRAGLVMPAKLVELGETDTETLKSACRQVGFTDAAIL